MRIITGLISLSIAIYLATFLTASAYQGRWLIRLGGPVDAYSLSSWWLWIPILYGIYNIVLVSAITFVIEMLGERGRRKTSTQHESSHE